MTLSSPEKWRGRPDGDLSPYQNTPRIVDIAASLEWHATVISRYLELDPQQRDKLEQFAREFEQSTARAREERASLDAKLDDLLHEPRFDNATAVNILNDLQADTVRGFSKSIDSFAAVYNCLNDLQRLRLRNLLRHADEAVLQTR